MIKLLYLAIVALVYLFNAYQSNQKKKQAELQKQQQLPEITNTAPPAYEQRKTGMETYTETATQVTPLRPKPVVQQQQKKPNVKPAPKPITATAASSIKPREVQSAEVDIHDDSLQQANNAYALTTDLESYVFNPRAAVIASIILQRPEY